VPAASPRVKPLSLTDLQRPGPALGGSAAVTPRSRLGADGAAAGGMQAEVPALLQQQPLQAVAAQSPLGPSRQVSVASGRTDGASLSATLLQAPPLAGPAIAAAAAGVRSPLGTMPGTPPAPGAAAAQAERRLRGPPPPGWALSGLALPVTAASTPGTPNRGGRALHQQQSSASQKAGLQPPVAQQLPQPVAQQPQQQQEQQQAAAAAMEAEAAMTVSVEALQQRVTRLRSSLGGAFDASGTAPCQAHPSTTEQVQQQQQLLQPPQQHRLQPQLPQPLPPQKEQEQQRPAAVHIPKMHSNPNADGRKLCSPEAFSGGEDAEACARPTVPQPHARACAAPQRAHPASEPPSGRLSETGRGAAPPAAVVCAPAPTKSARRKLDLAAGARPISSDGGSDADGAAEPRIKAGWGGEGGGGCGAAAVEQLEAAAAEARRAEAVKFEGQVAELQQQNDALVRVLDRERRRGSAAAAKVRGGRLEVCLGGGDRRGWRELFLGRSPQPGRGLAPLHPISLV
jgi:hypothetical protein